MTVRVITDTGAAMPPDVAAELDIRLVPLTITVGDRSYPDTEFDVHNLGSARATTSGPLPGEFVSALDGATDGAVIITLAAALSSTFSAARAAVSLADVPAVVVDSKSAAGAQALVALAATEQAQAGGDVDAVAATARAAAREVHLAGFLTNLDGLSRSGRVPGLAAHAVRMTGTHFMFALRDGRIRPVRPAASRAAALDRLVAMCTARAPAGDHITDVVLLGNTEGLDERLAAASVAADAPPDPERTSGSAEPTLRIGRRITGGFGAAVTLYTGPDVAGLAWRHRGGEER